MYKLGRSTLIGFVFVTLGAGCSVRNQSGEHSTFNALGELDLGARDLSFSGVVVLAERGKIVASRTIGYANIEFQVPNDLATRFKLHSLTKPLLAVVALRAVEAGKLELEAPVSRYLADWPESWRDVTVEQLLAHTSGIPDIAEMFLAEWAGDLPKTWKKVSTRASKSELQFKPGTKWRYCNAGYVLAANILVKIYGAPIAEVLERELFAPAKMPEAGLEETPEWASISYDGASVVPRLATGYNGTSTALQVAHSKMYSIPGAGGVYATASDLAAFAHAVFEQGLISNETVTRMTTVPSEREVPYALGWVIKDRNGRKLYRHDGGNNGFVTSLEYYPDTKISVIVLSNFGFASIGDLRDRVAKALFAE